MSHDQSKGDTTKSGQYRKTGRYSSFKINQQRHFSGEFKVDTSSSFPLQFGSISPGFMNGMQIPARTNSVSENLDGQEENKACHESVAPAVSTPSIPKQRLSEKDTRVLDQPNSDEAQRVSKSKWDAPQTQNPSVHHQSGMSMQMQFHQPQVSVQFGVPHPQNQSQATPTSSLPITIQMEMSIPLPLGNPPMFVSGLQPPHAVQSQGLMHQGQNLNYSLQLGHQMPPQFGGTGINMAPEFPPQQDAKFTASCKTVKFTHPETHGGLQRNNSDSERWPYETAILKGLMPSPQTSLEVMHKAKNKYEIGKVLDEEEIKQRQLRAILNKLTSQNFEKLFEQVKRVNIDNVVTLCGLASQIFDKALKEPTFCEIYADFSFHLAAELPDLSIENERINFKRLLLNKCQIEFERGEGEREKEEEANKADEEDRAKQSEEEREEKRLRARRRMLGNIRLIGELYKKMMLTERIMHECIKKLLGQNQNHDAEDVEALCILMSTIGEIIDHSKAKEHMDAYFDIMAQLSNNVKLSSRVRFMLKDSIDLRKNKWQQRRKIGGKKKIDQVHRDAAELGPQGGLQRNNSDSDRWPYETAILKGLMPSPQSPLEVMHKAENKYEIGKVSDEEEIKQRQLRAILNKLTSRNFEKMFEKMKQVNIDNVETLTGLISQIFDKALMKPTFCEIYANLCFCLAAELPDFSIENERITFKRLLLNKCQIEFERGEMEEEANKADEEEGGAKQSEEERKEKRLQARRCLLGNIRLIGELYKKRMLTERIMHECIKKLLDQYQNHDEENVEALCILMSTIGEMIDHPKAKKHMDAYFDIMGQLSNNMKLSSRVRYMLKDSIDLRKNKWQQRRKVGGQEKIDHVHRDATELGPQGGLQRNNSDPNEWQRGIAFQKGLMPSSRKAENKCEIGKFSDEEEIKQRQLKAILNKLTYQNFEKMFEQVKRVNIDNVVTLSGLISQIFDKALMKPTFCEIYANLCFHLAAELPDLSVENERITFKRLLLNRCQIEFERGEKEEKEGNKADEESQAKQSEEEREEKRLRARRHMLGNMRLIGELYKKRMLTERIMHECVKKLLGQYQNPDEEDVEALCILMSTIGATIDYPRNKEHIDTYFDIMAQLSNNMKLSSGVRLTLKETIDLRKNKWQQRMKVEDEVHGTNNLWSKRDLMLESSSSPSVHDQSNPQ